MDVFFKVKYGGTQTYQRALKDYFAASSPHLVPRVLNFLFSKKLQSRASTETESSKETSKIKTEVLSSSKYFDSQSEAKQIKCR
jgi:hypothetical protein